MQLRELRLVGPDKQHAVMRFDTGSNVISGDSDTGKSYILRCIDYVLGAETMSKKIDEDKGYTTAFLEFWRKDQTSMTLVRDLSGGDIRVHYQPIDEIRGDGEVVAWKRQGTSKVRDITSVFFPFAEMKEANLRKSKKGKLQRLTVRTLLPAFIVDENAIIAESSPVYGGIGFDQTARKRMLSFLLTGLDDSGVVSFEAVEQAQASARAKLSLVNDLISELDGRLRELRPEKDEEGAEFTIERADDAISRLSGSLAENKVERQKLQAERSEAIQRKQTATSQIVALQELLSRYKLLDQRYASDLQRLDFISEGSHFIRQLQEARCPLCDQPMDAKHREHFEENSASNLVYESSTAEAAKILGLRNDLMDTIQSIENRLSSRTKEQADADSWLNEINGRIDRELAPALNVTRTRLDKLIVRRVELEKVRTDQAQLEHLRILKNELERSLEKPAVSAPKDWADVDSIATRKFCDEIEEVLREWSWPEQGSVDFDNKHCDINVDGKPRISHGKGVRAILHAAFTIGLLRFCTNNNLPHPGFVVLDSPLTSYKEGRDDAKDKEASKIDPTIENGFWSSLSKVPDDIQIVIMDNKEPPLSVATTIKYTYFAGRYAKDDERQGFIPTQVKRPT